MNIDQRSERLRVLLDPWCPHDPTALDGTDTTDVFAALACMEARRDALDAAWAALTIVLGAMADHATTSPELALDRSLRGDDDPTFVRRLAAALEIGWAEPFDQRRNR